MSRRLVLFVLALLLLGFGAASLHYTGAEDVDHHREWAGRHDMPPPQPAITVMGWVALAAGTLCLATSFRKLKSA